MSNELNEMDATVNPAGRDINVIEKQLLVTVGIESTIFEIAIWFVGFIPALIVTLVPTGLEPIVKLVLWCAGILPGIIYCIMKINARSYLQQLQQEIQQKASTIDNYLEQRVVILQNVVPLLEKAIDLDKDVMKTVSAFRGGAAMGDNRSQVSAQLDTCFRSFIPQLEAYPDLKAHASIADAMRQNSYLQKEITAARELYNDTVAMWNTVIYEWPVKRIVAAKARYTTRIPFTTSAAIKEQARGVFF